MQDSSHSEINWRVDLVFCVVSQQRIKISTDA